MKKSVLSILLIFILITTHAQGRVVINEYMPWPATNSCSETSEFIELLNFGPGPINIGCYILTEGDYAITIPPNTILQPGQFFIIAGQATIAKGCANLDEAITVNLNWNNCSNCTSAPIPSSGDGLFTDGGAASEQLVLLDPNLNVVDAVVRDITRIETSDRITTAVSGGCGSKTFDLDDMAITYEMIGESAGNANSFARKVDGDCAWMKETQQSGGGSNNSSGNNASVNYTLNFVRTQDCDATLHGAISITANGSNISSLFPFQYTLIRDSDNDNVFEITDEVTNGTDATPSNIDLNGLVVGRYRIAVASALGCNLKTFNFEILACEAVLPLQLLYFRHAGSANGMHRFAFGLADVSRLQEAMLEQSMDGQVFHKAAQLQPRRGTGIQNFSLETEISGNRFFRLRLLSNNGAVVYSPVINTGAGVNMAQQRIWPNPADKKLHISISNPPQQKMHYSLVASSGQVVAQGLLQFDPDSGTANMDIAQVPAGFYQLILLPGSGKQPISLRFVKQ